MKFPEIEIEMARHLFLDQICEFETGGRSLSAFASAALLAASEIYAEIHGGPEVRKAFDKIAEAQQLHSGTAGRA